MADTVRITLHGLGELEDALTAFTSELATELAPGFIPEHRFAGEGGVPFVSEKVQLAGERVQLAAPGGHDG